MHRSAVWALLAFFAGTAAAVEEKPFGRPGEPKKVERTVRVDMSDAMRFTPAMIEVRQNVTVRFIVKNSGKVLHEMVLGTMAELKEHAARMRRHLEMEHDGADMIHVAPGKSGSMVWQFSKAGEFHYACLMPGHFEAGMVGRIRVVSNGDASALTEGEVRKVDRNAKKITIQHGPITNLHMPAMTMVFQVKDPAMLEQVKTGDKVKFIAEKVGGAFTVTKIEQTK